MAGRTFDRGETVNMCPQQRARLQAYEPSKDAQRWMAAAGARARVHLTEQKSGGMCNPSSAAPECDRQKQIIAQLKATEARNRVRNMRLRYERIRAQEIRVMIPCQPSAWRAQRLELMLSVTEKKNHTDNLDPAERRRLEEILDNEKGLTMLRR
ncbi:protein LKAAEAR1-like [Triplophysa dalaica]|uniref:protein LKAAEAR1-like n=1 Tax=Triplophysa dalaica TaxID=1582913 RepID=UPI0024DF72BD|nr:protein LKAAEAR1-like [Triplophysa dalaica]